MPTTIEIDVEGRWDAVALMAFSASTSVAVAVGFLLLAHLGHSGR